MQLLLAIAALVTIGYILFIIHPILWLIYIIYLLANN